MNSDTRIVTPFGFAAPRFEAKDHGVIAVDMRTEDGGEVVDTHRSWLVDLAAHGADRSVHWTRTPDGGAVAFLHSEVTAAELNGDQQ